MFTVTTRSLAHEVRHDAWPHVCVLLNICAIFFTTRYQILMPAQFLLSARGSLYYTPVCDSWVTRLRSHLHTKLLIILSPKPKLLRKTWVGAGCTISPQGKKWALSPRCSPLCKPKEFIVSERCAGQMVAKEPQVSGGAARPMHSSPRSLTRQEGRS